MKERLSAHGCHLVGACGSLGSAYDKIRSHAQVIRGLGSL